MKPMNDTTEITVNQRTHSAPNQSASWPLSKTICIVRQPHGQQRETDVINRRLHDCA